jgi:hypothetical protein
VQKLDLGFSIADCTHPDIKAASGTLAVSFTTSGGEIASVSFAGVAAYA